MDYRKFLNKKGKYSDNVGNDRESNVVQCKYRTQSKNTLKKFH